MANVIRAPAMYNIDLAAILKSQDIMIDLRIREYEDSTRNFLKAVSSYTSRAMEEITRRKTAHAQELKRLTEKKQQIEAETTTCKIKEIKLMEILESEQTERRDAESSVSELKRQFASIQEKCASVDVEIEQYRIKVATLRREKNKETSTLDTHTAQTTLELKECEERLKCVLEGVDRDKLLVSFADIDRSNLSREFSLVIDVSSRLYKVPVSTPLLPTLPILVDELNKTRDVYWFIKHVREAFESMVQNGL